jgi:glycosyltransferase involved in cell wall biosynthesis
MKQHHFGFILEQALGHITHTQNLQVNIARDPSVRASWGLVPFDTTGLARYLPVYKSNWTVRAGWRARQQVKHIVRESAPDALFFHTQVPAILSTNWIKHYPSVVSLDATPIQYDSLGQAYSHEPGPLWLEKLKWQLNRDCFRAARHLVTWSSWAKAGLVADYEVPAEKITVIPPGVNPLEWAPPDTPSASDQPTRVLFVGGDLERKGGNILLAAFRRLRHLNVELHLVTRTQLAPEEGVYVYSNLKPNSPELKQLYHQSDLFCLPTYGDCLPMVLSEAGAAGLPSISTRVAAIPEVVRDGESGLIVPVGDSDALHDALHRLILQPAERRQMGKRAMAVVRQHFDAQRNAERLIELLKLVSLPVAQKAQAPV